jgi:phosphoglycerate-specific signal transduction histidine kinase
MPRIRIGSSLLFFTLLTACSSQSSSDKVVKEVVTIASWTHTAQMVGDAWIHGNVPTSYAKQTLSQAHEKLQKEAQKLAKIHATQEHPQILQQLKQLETTLTQMSKAVERNDRAVLSQQMQQLSTEAQPIDKLAHSQGGQS